MALKIIEDPFHDSQHSVDNRLIVQLNVDKNLRRGREDGEHSAVIRVHQ